MPAGSDAIEHDGLEPFGGGIHRGGDARGPRADNRQINIVLRAAAPHAGAVRQIAQRRIQQNAAIVADDRRCLLGRTNRAQRGLAIGARAVQPCERHEVLVQELANDGGVFARARPDDSQADVAGSREQRAASLEGREQDFTQARNAVEQVAEFFAGNLEQHRPAARDAVHHHWPAGQQVDVAGELPGLVRGDVAVVVGGIEDLDFARQDDKEVHIGTAGLEDDLAIAVAALLRQRPNGVDIIRAEGWESRFVVHGTPCE